MYMYMYVGRDTHQSRGQWCEGESRAVARVAGEANPIDPSLLVAGETNPSLLVNACTVPVLGVFNSVYFE